MRFCQQFRGVKFFFFFLFLVDKIENGEVDGLKKSFLFFLDLDDRVHCSERREAKRYNFMRLYTFIRLFFYSLHT